MGYKLNSASAAGDPWTAELPGDYSEGSAGYELSNLFYQISQKINELPDIYMAEIVDGDVSLKDAWKIMLALFASKSRKDGNTFHFRDVDDTKNRLSVTINSNKERT